MADDRQNFASKMMGMMFSRGEATPLQGNLSAITQNLNANFDRMLQGARAVTDPYIVSSLDHIDPSTPFDRNAANIVKNFQTLDNKIRIVDKNVRVNTTLLQYNKRLMEATNASLNRAIAESRNDNRRSAFTETENRLEEAAINQAIDRRINAWIDAGLIGGGGGGRTNAGGLLTAAAAGAGTAGILKAAAGVVARNFGSVLLLAGLPQAMDNPDQNMYTDIGSLLDWTKTLVDPSYKGTEARDLARSIVRKIKDYDTSIQRKKDQKKFADEIAKKRGALEQSRRSSGYYDPDYEYTDAEKKQISEAAARRKMEADIAAGNPNMAKGPTRRGRIRRDWMKVNGSDFGRESELPFDPNKLPIPDDLKVPGYDYKEEPKKLLRLPFPDELKVPGHKYPIERLESPTSKKVSSLFGRGGRIQVASLGDGREFLPTSSSPEEAYADRLSNFVRAGEEQAEDVEETFSKFNLTTGNFGIRARLFDLYAFSTFKLEAQGEITLKSKRSLVIEAPEIALIGKIGTYATAQEYDRATGGAGGASANPLSTNNPLNMPSRAPNNPMSDLGSPFGLMNGGGGRAPIPAWAGGGGGGGGGSTGGGAASGNTLAASDLPPEAAALLNTIAAGEAGKHGYNAINYMAGGGAFEGFGNHPFAGQKGYTAAGRYQILASNWEKYAPMAGVTDFSPESQDKVAWVFAQDVYKRTTGGRDLSTDLKDPNFDKSRITSALKPTWHGIKGGSMLTSELQAANNPTTGTVAGTSGGDYTATGGAMMPSSRNILDPSQVPHSGGSKNSRIFGGNRGHGKLHTGVDVPVTVGEPIQASMNGKVVRREKSSSGYGYVLDVEYEDGTVHRYAHLGTDGGGSSSAFAKGLGVGSEVKAGETIGYGGYSGNAGPEFPHYHYEIIKGEYYKDTGGRPPGRADTQHQLEAGRIDPMEYWQSQQDAAAQASSKPPVAGIRVPKAPVKPVDRVAVKTNADELMRLGGGNSAPIIGGPKTIVVTPAPEPKKPTQNTHDNVNMSASGMLNTSSMIV